MQYIRSTFGSRRIALLAGAFVAFLDATPAAAGCNSGHYGNENMVTSANCLATASSTQSTAIGLNASAAESGTALGHTALTGDGAVAMGSSASALGRSAVSMGLQAGPRKAIAGAIAIGGNAGYEAAGVYSIAIGTGKFLFTAATAPGDSSVAIGGGGAFPGALATGYRSIAIGQSSTTGDGNGVTGFGLGDFGTSVGFNTHTAFAATALGTDAQAKGDSSTALGRFANASAASSLALGQGAVANRARAVALGSGSLANVADTVSVGTNTARRRIVNVQNGAANSDAATLGQVKAIATTAAIEALANETIAKAVGDTVSDELQRELRQMRSMIERLQQEIAELKSRNTAALAK